MKPNQFEITNPPRVAILAYNNLATFEFSCAVELFSLPRPEIPNWYQSDVIAVESGQLMAVGGFKVECQKTLSKEKGFDGYDMLVIPGWKAMSVDKSVPSYLVDSILSFYKKGGTLVSFCSGAFVLAATGLLNNKVATTHWLYEDSFREKFPKVVFKENVLFTEEERIFTSAGSASALDLGIHIIAKDYGVHIANKIAKRLVIAPQRQGGQSQFASKSPLLNQADNLSNSLEWARNHLYKNITIDDLAKNACVSRRSFDRNFRKSMGLSPKEWLIEQRVNFAREQLEKTSFSIELIAEKSGLGSAMNMRHHFAKTLGVSPSYYRKQFLQI